MLRSTKSAEKHVLLWHVYFFNGNGETYMKCWEAQNLLKNMFCCDMSIFLMEMAKLTWNAEKQVMLRSKKYLLKSMFCCDMSNFFDGKNLNYWCLIGEHSRNTQTGTKRYGRFIFVYMLIFFVLISTILLRGNYCAEKHWKTNLTRNAMSTIYPITECHQPQVCWTKTSRFVSTVDLIYMTWIHVGSNQGNIE